MATEAMQSPGLHTPALHSPAFSWLRVFGMGMRYFYLLRGSWPRVIDQVFWPTMQVIIWGFATQFFLTNSSYVAQAGGVLLAAVMLWDLLFRSQLGVSVMFMEELFARNLGYLFVSPLRPVELVVALVSMSVVRTALGCGAAMIFAIILYRYSIFELGVPLVGFFIVLGLFGWSMGLMVCAALLRYGLGVEGVAWAVMFALAPISGIYYPIETLPDWLQVIAWLVPSSHIFEGMRTVLFEARFDTGQWLLALAQSLAYLLAASVLLTVTLAHARGSGALLRAGE